MNNMNKRAAGLAARACVLAASAWVTAGCDDFLSIVPLNDVVLENYWTEEADVRSVVNSCYAQLESGDCLKRMLVWGELRSDNLTTGTGAPLDVQRITDENILETNGYAKWDAFYQCINRCNTVIHYAPEVQEKDPNYTEAEMKANIAEVTAIRSLCYFYLIRAFRDVPYVTEPSIDDAQTYRVPADKFDVVLARIIADLEAVKEDAVRSYGEYDDDNVNRVTRYAIYAMLADMYLWQGDYARCVEYCDRIIKFKKEQYEDMLREDASFVRNVELYGSFPLISEAPRDASYAGTAFTEIFGKGNSFESIFELDFVDGETTRENQLTRDFYGTYNGSGVGQIAACPYLNAQVADGTNKYFGKTDCRVYENMHGESTVTIRKYVKSAAEFRTSTVTGQAPEVNFSDRSANVGNWILYRLTDVMLMKAEAEVELAGNVGEGSSLTTAQDSCYRVAFSCVSAVWKRANNKRTATDTLSFDDYGTSRMSMQDLVLDERQRELMFEGKRWFDLVRLCRREGSNTRMLDKITQKFSENTAALRIRLAAPDALYYPYHEDELKANPYLVQNQAYENDNINTTE